MGLFDKLVGSREERDQKRIRDLQKRAEEVYGDPTQRAKALEQLRDVGTPEAIFALFHRFTAKVDPGITDAEEKDRTLEMIVAFGDKAVDPCKTFLASFDGVAWGLRALDELVSPEQARETVLELLRKLSTEYTRTPEKKVLLIRYLGDHEAEGIGPVLTPFLDDAFDDVKIAAMEVLAAHKYEGARDALLDRMLHDEAPRVRQAAAAALTDLGVSLADRKTELTSLPPGFELHKGGTLRRS